MIFSMKKAVVVQKRWNAHSDRRLFFRPDKVTFLIAVFSVLAALTPRRLSSAYLPPVSSDTAVRHDQHGLALGGEWCSFYHVFSSVVLTPRRRSSFHPSDGGGTPGKGSTIGQVSVFSLSPVSVQLTPCPCPPSSHPLAYMSRIWIWVCMAAWLRSRFVAGAPTQSTAAGV